MSFGMIMQKPKYGEKAKLCYMDADSFLVYIKTGDIYKVIAEDVETRFDTSNYELDRPLPKKKVKSNWINEDELGGNIITRFVRLRANYLIDDGSEDKKLKGTKRCVIKRKLENNKNCLEAIQLDNKINYLQKSKIEIDSFKKVIKIS